MSDAPPSLPKRRPVLFPNGYVWFVFISTLDIMLTWVILHFGGREVNAVADHIIWQYGLPGLVAYKFALVVGVIAICEVVGRRRSGAARFLLGVGITVTCFPVLLALVLLLLHGRQ
jgi:hypothetical protein